MLQPSQPHLAAILVGSGAADLVPLSPDPRTVAADRLASGPHC